MSNLVSIQNNQVVVSSRQVAESFGKEHSKVIRSVEQHINDLEVTAPEVAWFYESSYIDGKGEARKEYRMNRDGFSLLVMSFNNTRDILKWKLKYIQAFNKMEQQLLNLLPDFTNPAIAARAWANEYEGKLLAQTQIRVLQPKAEVFDKFVDRGHAIGFRELAKELCVKENVLRDFLFANRIAYRQGGKWKPYAESVHRGWMVVKDVTNESNGFTTAQALFTMEGKKLVQKIISVTKAI